MVKDTFKLEETHIDYVLVGKKYAYKIKKPIKFSFVDYSTLKKRHHFCQEEIRLNRRYSPTIYLGVTKIKDPNGKIIDYAVKMKSFKPEERLDYLLSHNKVNAKMIAQIAQLLANFHQHAIPAHKRESGTITTISKVINDNFRNIYRCQDKVLAAKDDKTIKKHLFSFLSRHHHLFEQRKREGKIKDLHGDLHSENLYYRHRPYLLDCVEFNSTFRFIDSAAEMGMLLMSFDFAGQEELGLILLSEYLKRTEDFSLLPLLNFYKCHYAVVRGMVDNMNGKRARAKQHYQLALHYAAAKPTVFVLTGVIGTGKSFLAQKLAENLDCKLLRSDAIRKELAHFPVNEHPTEKERDTLYNNQLTIKVYQELYRRAKQLLKRGFNVVLDATYNKASLRTSLRKIVGKQILFIAVTTGGKTIRQRLKNRRHDISDARPWLLSEFLQSYEAPTEISKEQIITINNTGNKATVVKTLITEKKLLGTATSVAGS
jgi:hypothetical protein